MHDYFNFVAAIKVAHNLYRSKWGSPKDLHRSLTPAQGELSFVSNLLTNHTGQFKMKVSKTHEIKIGISHWWNIRDQ